MRYRITGEALLEHRCGRTIALSEDGIGLSYSASPPDIVVASDGIARIDIQGALLQRAEVMCGMVDGYDAITARICTALEDKRVRGLVLRIDSPGGDVAGLEEAITQIRSVTAQSGKPISTYVDELCASAAYWLAAGVSTAGIYAPPSAIVGSIGVYCVLADEREALAKRGVALRLVRDPPGKDAGNPIDPVSDVALASAERLVAFDASRFYAAISQYRGIDPASVRGLNGAVFHAQDALSHNLIDAIAGPGMASHAIRSSRITAQRSRVMVTKAAEGESATASEVSASCRECAVACNDCADALDSGTVEDALAGAKACMLACEANVAMLKSFLNMSDAPVEEAPVEEAPVEDSAMAAKVRDLELRLAAQELASKRAAIVELIRVGAETPATAWNPDGSPRKHLAVLTVDEIRERGAALGNKRLTAPIVAPVEDKGQVPKRILEAWRAKGLSGSKLDSAIANYVRASSRAPLAQKVN